MNPTEKMPVTQAPEELLDQLSENKLPQSLPEEVVANEILKAKDSQVLEMPAPGEAPKVEVSAPNPPRAPEIPVQRKIPVDLQLESIGKKICKLKGHSITAIVLRTTRMGSPGVGPFPSENTIVICTTCGASLAQIRS
jgi:hypothetical protein